MNRIRYRLTVWRCLFWDAVMRVTVQPLDTFLSTRSTHAWCDRRDIEIEQCMAQLRLSFIGVGENTLYLMAEQVRSVALGHYPYNIEASDEAKRVAEEMRRAGIKVGG